MTGFAWHEMLAAFRQLGGIAENVIQRQGPRGRGLFFDDPALPARIVLPEALLVDAHSVELRDGQLRIRDDAGCSPELCAFFEHYQLHYSWGRGGREEVEPFERALQQLPPEVKQYLQRHQIVDLQQRHAGSWQDVVVGRFLEARVVRFQTTRKVLAPVWELLNHSVSARPFRLSSEHVAAEFGSHVSRDVAGSPGVECLIKYSESTPLRRLLAYGFTTEERFSFAFPFTANLRSFGITLVCRGEVSFDDAEPTPPQDGRLVINSLPIGNAVVPSQPVSYLAHLLGPAGLAEQAPQLYRMIAEANQACLDGLLQLLRKSQDDGAKALIHAVNLELALIANSLLC